MKMSLMALMVEAVSTSETSVSFYPTTRHIIPEDSHILAVNYRYRTGHNKVETMCNLDDDK
jgi:hypothetical protein